MSRGFPYVSDDKQQVASWLSKVQRLKSVKDEGGNTKVVLILNAEDIRKVFIYTDLAAA